jgi:hypothetical protein
MLRGPSPSVKSGAARQLIRYRLSKSTAPPRLRRAGYTIPIAIGGRRQNLKRADELFLSASAKLRAFGVPRDPALGECSTTRLDSAGPIDPATRD